MSNLKYKYVIASDLDGTLLSKGEIISPENQAAIEEMERRGICFAPNSGRTFSEMPEAVLKNPHIRYYIGADGAAVWDKQTGQRIELCMSREEFARVFDILSDYSTLDTVRYNGRSYADRRLCTKEGYEKHRLSHSYGEFIDYYLDKVDDFDMFVRGLDKVEMVCTFFANDKDQEECRQRIEALGDFVVSSSEPKNIEVFHKRAGKGSALLKLADALGVPHERTIAVGDGFNDMDMIKKAGISLAMGNAVDELKAIADRVICDCSEHSAKYILENVIED